MSVYNISNSPNNFPIENTSPHDASLDKPTDRSVPIQTESEAKVTTSTTVKYPERFVFIDGIIFYDSLNILPSLDSENISRVVGMAKVNFKNVSHVTLTKKGEEYMLYHGICDVSDLEPFVQQVPSKQSYNNIQDPCGVLDKIRLSDIAIVIEHIRNRFGNDPVTLHHYPGEGIMAFHGVVNVVPNRMPMKIPVNIPVPSTLVCHNKDCAGGVFGEDSKYGMDFECPDCQKVLCDRCLEIDMDYDPYGREFHRVFRDLDNGTKACNSWKQFVERVDDDIICSSCFFRQAAQLLRQCVKKVLYRYICKCTKPSVQEVNFSSRSELLTDRYYCGDSGYFCESVCYTCHPQSTIQTESEFQLKDDDFSYYNEQELVHRICELLKYVEKQDLVSVSAGI